jgi:catechol 2,3-dioxygenase-like lactoylglutathione lyase family enzyme
MALSDATPVTFILTADREKATVFYRDVLGLRQTGEDEYATSFDLAGTPLRLTSVEGHVPGPHTVLGWNVPDISATAAELKSRGVKFEIYEGFGQDADGIWHAPDRDVKIAWFLDPEGNNLSITQF